MKVSKELLAQILGDEYLDRVVEVIQIEDNYLRTYYDCGSGKPTGLGLEYNLYELAHLAKQWAYRKGFLLDSRVTLRGSCFLLSSPVMFENEISKNFVCDSEPDAVFTACEWIMRNQS